MGYYITVDESLFANHKKVIRLAARLKLAPVYAIAHLSALWAWGIANAPDGQLGDTTDEELAIAAQYPVEQAETFAAALEYAKWIDRHDDGTRELHDWMDHTGKTLEKLQREAQRKRDARAGGKGPSDDKPGRVRGQSADSPQDIHRTGGVDETRLGESRLDETSTPQTPPQGEDGAQEGEKLVLEFPEETSTPEEDAAQQYPEWFEEIWKVYPNKAGKLAAYNAATALTNLPKGQRPRSWTVLREAVKAYVAHATEQGWPLKHLSTFFSKRDRWYEEYANGQQPATGPEGRSAANAPGSPRGTAQTRGGGRSRSLCSGDPRTVIPEGEGGETAPDF